MSTDARERLSTRRQRWNTSIIFYVVRGAVLNGR